MTEIIAEHKVEQTIFYVLLIIQRQLFLSLCDGEILAVVYEYRLDRLHLCLLDSLYIIALLVAVGLYRSDGWLVYLLLQRVYTLNLEDSSIAVGEESVGKVHNLLLSHLRNAVQVTYLTFPLYAIDKGIHKFISTPAVVLHCALVAQLLIVHYRWQQIVREVTLLQVLNLGQHQFANLLQRLVWLWLSHQYEC